MADDQQDLKLSKNRLEALVDGIFAFAMTLLVTGLAIPHFSETEAEAKLPISIAEMHSEFIAFLVAFFVLASFWRTHNRHFHYVQRIDSGVMRITLFILVCVILMPFTTHISGAYSDLQLAVGLFHINMFSLGLFFLVNWWYLTRRSNVTSVAMNRSDASRGMYRALITPGISALAFVLSFSNPSWSMATYLLLIPCFAVERRCRRSKQVLC